MNAELRAATLNRLGIPAYVDAAGTLLIRTGSDPGYESGVWAPNDAEYLAIVAERQAMVNLGKTKS